MMAIFKQDYFIYKELDAPKRFLVFTLDELVSILLSSGIGIGLFHSSLIGVIAGTLSYMIIRQLKKNRPPHFWLHLMYAYLPRFISRLWFNYFPDYADQHFLT